MGAQSGARHILKLKEAREQREGFEQRYGMDFAVFKLAWEEGRVPNKRAYEVERDYWAWEAAITDEQRSQKMLDSLP